MIEFLTWMEESWGRVLFVLVIFFSTILFLLDTVRMLTNKSFTITECIDNVGAEYTDNTREDEPVQETGDQ